MTRIYSRASWGARYRNGVGTRRVGSLQKYLHHSVTKHLPASATVAEEKVQCRVVEAIGQQRFGAGISYTFLVFPSGRIYEGASINRISYHSGGGRDGKPRNTIGAGICLVGNTEANEMTPQQVAAVVWLLQHGVAEGWWGDPAITEGHRDFKATSCPGRHAYKRIPEMNRLGRSGSAPTSEPTSDIERLLSMAIEPEDFRPAWEFQARDTTPSAWTLLSQAAEAAEKPSLQQIREAQAFHAGKVDEANQRNLRTMVQPQIDNLVKALANVSGGEPLDEDRLLTGVRESAEQGAYEGTLRAEATLREALIEAMSEQPERDAEAVADAVLDKMGVRLQGGGEVDG